MFPKLIKKVSKCKGLARSERRGSPICARPLGPQVFFLKNKTKINQSGSAENNFLSRGRALEQRDLSDSQMPSLKELYLARKP